MPRKCCVPLCKANYVTSESQQVFRFPKDNYEQQRWIRAIPRKDLLVNNNTVVCRQHWPDNFPTYLHRGKERPVNPPSVFIGIPPSCCRSIETPRKTKKTLSSTRSILPDELSQFNSVDLLKHEDIEQHVLNLTYSNEILAYKVSQSTVIQSKELINGIPKFVLTVSNTLHYQAYHKGVQCTKQLTKTLFTTFINYLKLEENK